VRGDDALRLLCRERDAPAAAPAPTEEALGVLRTLELGLTGARTRDLPPVRGLVDGILVEVRWLHGSAWLPDRTLRGRRR
jgi:hypothetical protein